MLQKYTPRIGCKYQYVCIYQRSLSIPPDKCIYTSKKFVVVIDTKHNQVYVWYQTVFKAHYSY